MTLDVAPQATGPAQAAVPFASNLRRHGNRLAVVTPDGTPLTYHELADRVDAMRVRLTGTATARRLVLIAASNDIEPLVAYLAALSAGHPVLLAPPQDDRVEAMVSAYDPDVVLRPDGRAWRLVQRRENTAHDPHPELALLLSTSGSTGSPKLVRLSARNVRANAESIASYLDIRDTDRAIASLPIHYSYGLSVVNSNLLRGSALLLTGESVVTPRFWQLARQWGATSLHGVPYTFELLDTVGFDRMELPSLRYVTQAGGRLEPDRVRRLAELGQREGWRLFVMYGQTEATARMAYLPPELALTHPDTIGDAIPGGSFRLADARLTGDGEEGQLVYRGPNVMLGYAESPDDLALGRTVRELETGDIARRTPEGLYRIVGRASRFIKPFGLRIDLDHVEATLALAGHEAACTGTDDGLLVAVAGGAADVEAVRRLVRDSFGLPAAAVRVREVDELPRLANGKIDYAGLEQAPTALREVFTRVFGIATVADDATFVNLGGDSLSYVRMATELEKVLGTVPEGWPNLTVRELERLRPRRRRFPAVETNVVLRALAILLVVGTHVGFFGIMGGAHLLLVLAGWTFARFGLADGEPAVAGRVLRGAARVAVPSMLWLWVRAFTEPDVGAANIALLSNYVPGPVARGYWFIEVLVQALLVFGLLFAVPAVRAAERRHPFRFPLAVLAVALALNLGLAGVGQPFDHAMSLHGALWFFVLGWLALRADTPRRKAAVALLGLLLVSGYFGDPVRDGIVVGGLVLLLTVPTIALPTPFARLLTVIAGASLSIYLTHYAVYPGLLAHLPTPVVFAASIAVGVVAWLAVEFAVRLAGERAARRASAVQRATCPTTPKTLPKVAS
ncbi:acyl-CoA synthetase (AMP-forming)/AMP-acid ligase II [Saccharomonospora marina XMU15]|uniref:Acyl-CoA synthetase (AMP-forming)/AMP-acid ligase II n=1 Tax=Saccharomonospora marina XMU15 TaxID=882083 RepID=H5X5I8_9PSEU|nr:AMP-binding protein [Saccharomonospora marina]EHR50060.1 acyl-CoA synthetase (AMP-forming)/AMP-acid ligase II [Saccharomonospora marina XMU15]